MEENLIQLFFDKYTTREETSYRLPMNLEVDEFWPKELKYRRERAIELPLHSADGHTYCYNRTDRFIKAADIITEMARNTSGESVFVNLTMGNLMDEAYYSSAIEGAYSSREQARKFIESGCEPSSKDEQMILNNYLALRFLLDNLDSPITEELIKEIGRILTEGTSENEYKQGYRNDNVYVISSLGETIYTAPSQEKIGPMMKELVGYIDDASIHPIERAVVAHVFFVTVHPFFDGNGRTARALTYMILLKSGYDFFRLVPISGILSEKRGRYYKALRASQDPSNGYDLTYFTDFYTELLAETLESVRRRMDAISKYQNIRGDLDPIADIRIIKGINWIINDDISSITGKAWQKKFDVSFETARKDLNKLAELGYLEKVTQGHKNYYMIKTCE